MPWKPRVSEEQVSKAVAGADSWRAVLDALGYAYHGKNIATVRKWAERWGIDIGHLSDQRGRPRHPRYTEEALRDAVAESCSWAETLRRLGYCPTGGNWRTLKRRVAELGISTDHFDPYAAVRRRTPGRRIPLDQILIEGSTYSRTSLKRRLFETGLKARHCEICGQDENWHGATIGLILDHVNGVRDDNRIENLRIVCPNCAAGLDTHCGRKNRIEVEPRSCVRCSAEFFPRYPRQRYCSAPCGRRWDRTGRGGQARVKGVARLESRRVERPPYRTLLAEIERDGYLATGRRYGVSDNAIRKWVRFYESEIERKTTEEGDQIGEAA
jgi:hypothetical protein